METKLNEIYRLKNSASRPDLIIDVSYQSIKFIIEQGREISTGLPVVFTALLDLENNKV